ncbi:DUF5067 domain-containing protein [Microbacterium oleivorans]|uniref:DUF5067 domain-containing protein n=1 Tax=Microbacterium oleivorans TaxID=273677 RepID=A0A4R5YPF2_9MICO|nr:DUF5067 domain-containing protein [Microbacterium oleivorans]TDL45280.1 DUF5067 domain-containing protein [Microbacterium oleivorans]
MKRLSAIVPFALLTCLALTGCTASGAQTAPAPASQATTEVEVDAPEDETPDGPSFVDGVLTTDEVVINITDSKVIPVGEKGNEYGDKPVLAIWYDTTNLGTSDQDITPSEFILQFEAFQDNDPNRENTLDVSGLPDDQYLESQMENIKAGGTVANAVAYSLDDTTTPVDLVAGRFGDEIGRMTFKLG